MDFKQKKKTKGFALLNVVLGTLLLAGIIYLIMQAMTHFHSEEKARNLGEELSPIVAGLMMLDYTTINDATNLPLLSDTDSSCNNANALLKNIFPAAYIQSLKSGGFDLCATDTSSNKYKASVDIITS